MLLEQYNLEYYANKLRSDNLLSDEHLLDSNTTLVTGLEFHSNNVRPGTLFVCKGANFKKEYLIDAINRGAVGYVAESDQQLDVDVPYLLVSDIRQAMALLGEIFYNSPQDKLTLIGIGGTKGKTTTTYYVKAILDEYLKAQGELPAGVSSTITTYDGFVEKESMNTTPEAMDLQKHLAKAVAAGLKYMVMEVSSQALKYHRTAGLIFDVSIFLNIDEDHISPIEHPNFEDYRASKAKMFEQTKQLILNHESQEADYMFEKAKNAEEYYTFSLVSEEADYYVSDIETVQLKSQFHVHSKNIDNTYKLSMPGDFNVENAVAAIAVSDLLGIPQEYAKAALSKVQVPGRMGILSSDDGKIIAVADFAHNRLSFEQLAISMKKAYPDYRVISVFGAPGGKALGRRKELGTVGGKYSDFVILTMDDPAYESVQNISNEIAKFVEQEGTPYLIIEDREAAIREAFEQVNEKTIILAIGKGHEKEMKINGKAVPIHSDFEILKNLVKQYNDRLKLSDF